MEIDGYSISEGITKICEQGTTFDFLLRSTPNNVESIKYKIKTYAFDDGLPEECLEHVKTYRKILKGQNITTGEAAFALLRRLVKGKMLADLERIYVEESYTTTVANTTLMTAKLTQLLFLDRALQKQRRGMQRYV